MKKVVSSHEWKETEGVTRGWGERKSPYMDPRTLIFHVKSLACPQCVHGGRMGWW